MSIYGNNPSRSTWEFDATFINYDDMIAAKDNILYGRHVMVTGSGDQGGIYQKTNDEQNPFLYIGRLIPVMSNNRGTIAVVPTAGAPTPWPNTGEFVIDENGQVSMYLILGSLLGINGVLVDKCSQLGIMEEQEPNSVRLFTFPDQTNTDPTNATWSGPLAGNGFVLTGDGVGITYIQPTGDTVPAKLKLSAAPAWKSFTEVVEQVITPIDISTSGNTTTISGFTITIDSNNVVTIDGGTYGTYHSDTNTITPNP